MSLTSAFTNKAKCLAIKAYDFVVSGYLRDVYDAKRSWGQYEDAKKTEEQFGRHKAFVEKLECDCPTSEN